MLVDVSVNKEFIKYSGYSVDVPESQLCLVAAVLRATDRRNGRQACVGLRRVPPFAAHEAPETPVSL
jgi:hypothetical protein